MSSRTSRACSARPGCRTSCGWRTSRPSTRQLTGHAVRDIDFYLTYTAIQWAIVFVLAGLRRVHFEEQPMPGDVQDLIINRGPLERMLA